MSGAEIIPKYFPGLSSIQQEQFNQLGKLYLEWNDKINLISRKDIQHLYEHHILHSLAIAKVITFKPGSKIMDVGTGGGFPGIPLAIMFPDSGFLLVDSIGKKLRVVDDIVLQTGLKNVRTQHIRAEEVKEKFDFVVSRAVTDVAETMRWTRGMLHKETRSGYLFLKGGEVSEELKGLKQSHKIHKLEEFFKEEWFKEKYCIEVECGSVA